MPDIAARTLPQQFPIAKCLFCGKTPFGERRLVNGADGRQHACCVPCVEGAHDTARKAQEARQVAERRSLKGPVAMRKAEKAAKRAQS